MIREKSAAKASCSASLAGSILVAFPRWGPRISDQRDPEPWERQLEELEIVAPER